MTKVELVVLVDDQDRAIGTMPKSEVHQADTPLHQAFSCFIFRTNGDLVLQQRATTKVTWPNVWSNTCCGHPQPGETRLAAVQRRLNEELDMKVDFELFEVLPDYRYQASHLGVMEHEICPVFVGFSDNEMVLNPSEVQATQTVAWPEFVSAITDPENHTWDHLSVWCREEVALLEQSDNFQLLYKKFTQK